VHFDLPDQDETQFDLWRLCWGVNGILEADASIAAAQIVPAEFHARFQAVSREYVYRILNRPQRSALLRDTHFFIPYLLNVPAMSEAAKCLAGSHDFAAFRSTNSDRSNTNCSVSRAELLKIAEGQLEFWITADHFVYNMVRIIVGTLIEIGLGKRTPESLHQALLAGDRNLAGATAPPWGLTLNAVQYPEAYKLFETSSDLVSCPGERS
ncbi:MAG: tRNA pseudouridine synthase A, partial [Candidatus Angelobacter sp.]